jgi:hypothetical protein
MPSVNKLKIVTVQVWKHPWNQRPTQLVTRKTMSTPKAYNSFNNHEHFAQFNPDIICLRLL